MGRKKLQLPEETPSLTADKIWAARWVCLDKQSVQVFEAESLKVLIKVVCAADY